jgi:pyruvate dehydrogenase E1 component beta subunit
VIFHEHKGLYGRKGIVRRGAAPAQIGRAEVVREGRDVTVVATMLMVERALAAAKLLESEDISLEVIDLRWIRPLDVATVKASVQRTGRLLVAEEQVHAGGWGATVISELAMAGLPQRSTPRAVSLPGDICVSYSPPLEDAIIPSVERLAEVARAAVRE